MRTAFCSHRARFLACFDFFKNSRRIADAIFSRKLHQTVINL